jgi:hypothetical protein
MRHWAIAFDTPDNFHPALSAQGKRGGAEGHKEPEGTKILTAFSGFWHAFLGLAARSCAFGFSVSFLSALPGPVPDEGKDGVLFGTLVQPPHAGSEACPAV